MLELLTHPPVAISTSWEEESHCVTNYTLEWHTILGRSKWKIYLVLSGGRPIFPVEKRIELIRKITEDLNQRIEVVQIDGLLADFIA